MITIDMWFSAIKKDITNKYGSENYKLIFDGAAVDQRDYAATLKSFVDDGYVLKYRCCKKIDSKAFEIKPFESVCSEKKIEKLVSCVLSTFANNAFFTVNTYRYDNKLGKYVSCRGITVYSKNEIRMELGYLFMSGYSKVAISKKEQLKNGEKIYHLDVKRDSIEGMVSSGYLELEYF